MKIANIGEEIIHIFWTNGGTSMKFSGKMWLVIILKCLILNLDDRILEKPQKTTGGLKLALSVF